MDRASPSDEPSSSLVSVSVALAQTALRYAPVSVGFHAPERGASRTQRRESPKRLSSVGGSGKPKLKMLQATPATPAREIWLKAGSAGSLALSDSLAPEAAQLRFAAHAGLAFTRPEAIDSLAP